MTSQSTEEIPSGSPQDAPTDPREGTEAPQDWSMFIIMLAIIAALGFGGTAMMYRRAEASKLEAEAALVQARQAREQAEQAQKEALAQRRLADDLRAQLQQATAAESDARRRAESLEAQARAGDGRAGSDAEQARAAAQSLSELLGPVDPKLPVAPADMRAVLDAAAKELEAGKLKDNPASAGAVHSTLGRTYLSLGESAKAAEHLRRAIDLRKPSLGEKNPEVVKDQQALEKTLKSKP
ncbi:MAG: hypothetical protein IT436_02690 [Phycisphaerales bacterium]|nr:hypothetical protein [Phycisphaerales bacterium]